MTLLDRYIARQYLMNVVILVVILFCFMATVDVALNIDRYLRVAGEFLERTGRPVTGPRRIAATVWLVFDLWWPRMLMLSSFMLGLIMVGAMGFTFSQMVRHRELVAVLASGQSLHRVARPVLVVSLGLTGLQALNHEFVLPRVAPLLTRDQGDAGKRDLAAASVPLTPDGLGRLFYARLFDANTEELEGLTVIERDRSGAWVRRVDADAAWWDGEAWVLEGGVARGRRAGPPEAVERLETDLDPTALKMRRYSSYQHNLSWRQLGQMLERNRQLRARGGREGGGVDEAASAQLARRGQELERIRFGRVSTMATNILTLALVMPFFLTRVPRNMLAQSLKGTPIVMAALMGGILGTFAPVPVLPPQVAVFIPVLILAPLAVVAVSAVRT